MHILVNNKTLRYSLNPFTNFKKYSLFLFLTHHSLLGPVKFTASPLWHCKNTPKSPVNPSCCQCPFFFLSNCILVHCPAGFHSVKDSPFFEICCPLVPCPPFLASLMHLFGSLILLLSTVKWSSSWTFLSSHAVLLSLGTLIQVNISVTISRTVSHKFTHLAHSFISWKSSWIHYSHQTAVYLICSSHIHPGFLLICSPY